MDSPLLRVAAVTIAAATSGCDLGRPVELPPPGTISGAVTYVGASPGTLIVEAHVAMPADGPPLAAVTIDAPAFPQAYTLAGLAPGEIFLVGRLTGVDGAPGPLGSFPSILQVSPVVLEVNAGLVGADFEIYDEGSRPEGPVVENGTRTLSGTIDFAGQVRPGDVLRGALYRSYPASGAPADFQVVNVTNPVFPFAFSFTKVRDGSYYTVFYLDRSGDNPFGPGSQDTVAWALGPDGTPRTATVALGAGQSGVGVVLPAP